MKMTPQQYCLRWKHHHVNVQNMFAQLLEKERFCDVTLYCSPNFAAQLQHTRNPVSPQPVNGVSLRAHRVVLAACSELLGTLLGAHEAHGEPVLVIDGVEPEHLRALLNYMYTGEMNVHHSQLASLLKTAEELRIKGLTDIRWNNKDEPPDSYTGGIVATTAPPALPEPKTAREPEPHMDRHVKEALTAKLTSPRSVLSEILPTDMRMFAQKTEKTEIEGRAHEKLNFNGGYRTGGPPPLIKLPTKEKLSPVKREHSDEDSPSPKRPRFASGTEHTDEESLSTLKIEKEQEWQHGNLDITAERVVSWGVEEGDQGADSSREASEEEWADAPADIGSFLRTRLKVDGDNSADEESNDSAVGGHPSRTAASSSSSATASLTDLKTDAPHTHHTTKVSAGPKSSTSDPRFGDVVKLNDYLQHGRRPQFWEENYVKRVMEAVRLRELEMKQAAEILGVSYGTLYGRYRDVYGCINRPYRAVRDMWQAKGPADVVDRLQRGEITLAAAAQALGVSMQNLAAHMAEFTIVSDFEPIPIEIDPSLKMPVRTPPGKHRKTSTTTSAPTTSTGGTNPPPIDKGTKKVTVGSIVDEDPIPATVISAHETQPTASGTASTASPSPPPTYINASGKWPTIRIASIDSLRAPDPPPTGSTSSPTQIMKNRPDLTIVAAKKLDTKKDKDDEET